MTDLVGKRVRVRKDLHFMDSYAGKCGYVDEIMTHEVNDSKACIVAFDTGGRTWFYPHELEVLDDTSHPSA